MTTNNKMQNKLDLIRNSHKQLKAEKADVVIEGNKEPKQKLMNPRDPNKTYDYTGKV